MIRHHPAGSGHPYRVDLDQRWPVVPSAGQRAQLGVVASESVDEVWCEFSIGTGPSSGRGRPGSEPLALVLERVPDAAPPHSPTDTGTGHLDAAQSGVRGRGVAWSTSTPELDVDVDYAYRFVGERRDGTRERTRWFPFRAARWERSDAALAVSGSSRVREGSVERLTDGRRAWRVRFALTLADREHVTGFGERFEGVDQRGSALDAVVFEQYKAQGGARRTYMPMPFAHVVGGDGWGFHVQTSRRVWFDVGARDPRQLIVEAEVDADGRLPVAFFDGDPTAVLGSFLDGVGRAEELPDWVFRLWASGNEWNTQAEVLRQVGLHRDHGIPVGTMVVEAWSDESTFTAFRDARYHPTDDGGPHRLEDFTFPEDGAWPDPKGLVEDLHAQDIHFVLWQIPLLKMRPHPTGQARRDADAAVSRGYVIQEEAPDGSLRPYRNRGWWFPLALMPDLTDAEAARWWTDKRRYLVEQVGVDGFKTDGGEHAWGRDLVYRDGTRGDEGNNRFPVAYAAAYGALLRDCGKAPVTFSRAGYAGSQAHGAFWAGDENSTWDAFRWSMNAGLNAAACGIVYWGWDIAGFSGEVPDPELYLRAAAASAFVPIMQYHSEFNHHRTPSRDRTPWNIAERWQDDRVVPIFRRFVLLRESLLPYLAAQAHRTVATDRPLMRPLYFDHPADPSVWRDDPEWMLGDDLLVSPVVRPGARTWVTYLPEGRWWDPWSDDWIDGGRDVERPAPLDAIPLFVREGAGDDLFRVLGRGRG